MSQRVDRLHEKVSQHYMSAVASFSDLVQHAEKHLAPRDYARIEREAYRALSTFEAGAKQIANVFRMVDHLSPPPEPSRGVVVPFRRKSSKFPRPR